MTAAWVYYQKELKELARSYKLLWIPVVFLILGIMQPLAYTYLPEILQASGDVPPGLMEAYIVPGASEVMAQTIGQYGTVGMLVLALAAMNSISGERISGRAELIQVRPVSAGQIAAAKWLAQLTLLVLSLGAGVAGAWYYTGVLIGFVPWSGVLASAGYYSLWLLCVVSFTLLCSSFLRGAAAAGVALLTAAALSVMYQFLPSWASWTPAALTGLSAQALSGTGGGELLGPCLSAAVWIIVCVTGSAFFIERSKLPRE